MITEKLKDGRLRIRGASRGGLGYQEGVDIPLSPARKKEQERKEREIAKAKAQEEALQRVLEAKRKTKERRKKRKMGKTSDP